jgi:hypothetical protein
VKIGANLNEKDAKALKARLEAQLASLCGGERHSERCAPATEAESDLVFGAFWNRGNAARWLLGQRLSTLHFTHCGESLFCRRVAFARGVRQALKQLYGSLLGGLDLARGQLVSLTQDLPVSRNGREIVIGPVCRHRFVPSRFDFRCGAIEAAPASILATAG